jgi:PKD repeat protein
VYTLMAFERVNGFDRVHHPVSGDGNTAPPGPVRFAIDSLIGLAAILRSMVVATARRAVPVLLLLAALLVVPACAAPAIDGVSIFPDDHIWNARVDGLPLDPNSALYVSTIGAARTVHADFGSGLWDGGPIGIPYAVVCGTQPKVPVTFEYGDESDPGPYPIPPDAPIEWGSDRHLLVLDRDHRLLYEVYGAAKQPDGSWGAGSGAVFDLASYALRPDGYTSADAAGLPILPGLVRYDEVAAGEITHAIRFTAPETRRAYVWPARHFASSLTAARYPPMGQRFRLRADFNTSSFSPEVRVVLRALQEYGMVLADNGSSWYLSGAPDSRWDNDHLAELRQVPGSAFEAVDVSSLTADPDSGRVRPGVVAVPGGAGLPADTDGDGVYEDVNGNGRKDFADVVLYFNQMNWIAANEPAAAFDCNGNGRVDFADVVWLFNHL